MPYLKGSGLGRVIGKPGARIGGKVFTLYVFCTIDAVDRVEELRIPPGNHLEKLGGRRSGQWSIRVDAQWRLCFRFEDGHAWDVEFCDYH